MAEKLKEWIKLLSIDGVNSKKIVLSEMKECLKDDCKC